jgi:hypothetical protein
MEIETNLYFNAEDILSNNKGERFSLEKLKLRKGEMHEY